MQKAETVMSLPTQVSRPVTPPVFDTGAHAHPLTNACLHVLNRLIHIYQGNRYRVTFAAYTLAVSWTSAAIMYGIQRGTSDPATILQAWFIAISCFSGCGLAVVDTTRWATGSQVLMILTMEFGSIGLCSAIPSLLRLRSLWQIDCNTVLPSDANVVRRHYKVNLVVLWVCATYLLLFQLVAILFLVAACGMSVWWSIFHSASGFNNAGFGLDPRNFAVPELIAKPQLLLLFIFLIPTGNTLYPVWQRLMVSMWARLARAMAVDASPAVSVVPVSRWFLFNLSWGEFSEALDELMQCPSLYYTHLFSRRSTMSLLGMWLGLTMLDYLMFIPDYHTGAFVTTDHQWLQALFQTVTIRCAGMSIMDVTQLRLGHLMYWVLSMYLSAYPFMLTDQAVQRSPEEKAEDDASRERIRNGEVAVSPGAGDVLFKPAELLSMLSADNFAPSAIVANSQAFVALSRETLQDIAGKAQNTMAAEIGWLYLACIVIAYTENHTMSDGQNDAPVLRLLFEVTSAYGNVGLSLSSPQAPAASYSAVLRPLAQFIIIVLMYFGKFRGLPQSVNVDWVRKLVKEHRALRKRRLSSTVTSPVQPSAFNFPLVGSPTPVVASLLLHDADVVAPHELPRFTPLDSPQFQVANFRDRFTSSSTVVGDSEVATERLETTMPPQHPPSGTRITERGQKLPPTPTESEMEEIG